MGKPIFVGKIQPGSRVLIVDDVVTYDSRSPIYAVGSNTEALSLWAPPRSQPGSAEPSSPFLKMVRDRLLNRFPDQAKVLANEPGFCPDCFTNRETRFLTGLSSSLIQPEDIAQKMLGPDWKERQEERRAGSLNEKAAQQ